MMSKGLKRELSMSSGHAELGTVGRQALLVGSHDLFIISSRTESFHQAYIHDLKVVSTVGRSTIYQFNHQGRVSQVREVDIPQASCSAGSSAALKT